MAKRKNHKPQPPDDAEELRKAYDKYRREFTAADLQRYTVEEEGIPAEQVLAEMEEIHREVTRKRRKR